MRILVTADLHYAPARRADYLAFARRVEELAPDCFVLAGDVGHPLRLFRRGLQLFERLTCPRLLIAGNHDLYHSPQQAGADAGQAGAGAAGAGQPGAVGDLDSRSLWETHLPAVAAEEGFVWLEEGIMRFGSVGVCGTLGWYDYSAASPHLPFQAEDYPHLKKLVNHDADYIDWPWSDRAMARYLGKRFAVRLAALEDDPTVEQIVVVTHMPIFPPALPPYAQNELYSLQRAYLGNFTLGDLVQGCAKVSHVVSGHLHRAGQWRIERAGRAPAIDFHLVGSEKGRPGAVLIDC